MRPLTELRSFTREAARILAREKDLASYEIYCATAEHRIARLAYTSDIPSRGLEEFKSLHADGFQLRIAMRRDPHEVGAASEAGDFTSDSVRDAIRRAHDLPLHDGLKIEADLSTLAFQTKDATEGMTAFIEKRKPVFKDG